MARLPYATQAQFVQLMRETGLPENTPRANAFLVLAHSPAIGASVLRLVLALLSESDLDPRLRELIILRVSQRCDGQYAWSQHVAMARSNGVSDAQVAALERAEAPATLFDERERVAFTFADQVLDTCRASADPFAAARALFSTREVVELLLLIGYFRMIAGLMTTLDVELEPPFGAKVLDSVRGGTQCFN